MAHRPRLTIPSGGSGSRRNLIIAGGVLAVLVFAGLAVRWAPALTLSVEIAAPATERWLAPISQDVVREDVVIDHGDRQLRADFYRPAAPHGGVVLVHGLSRAGRRHPDLTRLALLLARHGELVLVPELDGLVAFRLSGREVEDVHVAAAYLARFTDSPGIAGFSFGAGPALLAAADLGSVAFVGSFGGYADLEHVITYVTTGVHSYRGRRYAQRQEEYNRWKLLALLVGFVEVERDARLLHTIAGRKLADPADDTAALEGDLGEEGTAVLALVRNRSEEAVPRLLARLPAPARAAMNRLSPLAAVARLHGRLLIAHGMADDSIPFTESLRLADAAGGRARVAILRTFRHAAPRSSWRSLADGARDALDLVRLADDLLSAR